MRMRSLKFLNIFLSVSLVLFPFGRIDGMQSSNYVIERDSINFSGMEDSESANYALSDTLGEVASGESQCPAGSCTFLEGGYRHNDAVASGDYISVSSPTDVTLSPSFGGISGGTGNGSATWKVTTNNLAGYQMDIKASTTPALKAGSYSFLDYVPAGATPDYDWSVAASASEFGYSVEGSHTVGTFLDDGSGVCASGSGNVADQCWLGFSTSDEAIATSASPNDPSGTDTIVKFRAEAGNQRMQQDGDYTATITVTVVEL